MTCNGVHCSKVRSSVVIAGKCTLLLLFARVVVGETRPMGGGGGGYICTGFHQVLVVQDNQMPRQGRTDQTDDDRDGTTLLTICIFLFSIDSEVVATIITQSSVSG